MSDDPAGRAGERVDERGMLILPDWLIAEAPHPARRGWGVRVLGDRIDALGPHASLREQYPQDAVVQAEQQVLSPGFVNAHTHLYGVLAHGIPLEQAPSGFWAFLDEFWWPLVEDRLDADMVCAATDLRCAQALESGVTSIYDVTEAPYALPGVLEAQAQIVRRWGLRAILSFEATERVSAENGALGLQENADFIAAAREAGGPLTGLMCFHTTFTCSAGFIQEAFRRGRQLGVPVHLHCSEGRHEPEYALEHFGMRPIHYYEHLGVLGPDMIASQCVKLDQGEIERMAATGVRMTHMPLSNCEVGGGIAPVPELIEAGVTVGLGSDGYVENFFEVMRGAFLIHKASHEDPRVMPAGLVWRLATRGGAQALGLEEAGLLAPGMKADLILIDGRCDTPLTEHNLYEQLLLYRDPAHIRMTMVDGSIRYGPGSRPPATIEALRQAAHQAARRLWQERRTFDGE